MIRRARIEDAAILADAERAIARTPGRLASRPDEIRDDAMRSKIAHAALFLVAEENGEIVGHGLLERRDLAVTSHVVFVSLAVHEGHQGKGFGKALMEELIAWARSAPDVEKIELNVRSSNDRAIGLYRSLGFVEEGRWTKRIKIGPGEYLDDVMMALWVGA